MELPPQPVKHFLNNATIKEQNAYFLAMMDPNFCHAQSFTEQVGILCSYVRNDNIRISFERIGAQFGKTKQSVEKHLKKYQSGKKPNGRPSILTQTELLNLEFEIRRLITNPTGPIYCTYEDLSDFLYFTYGKYIEPNTLSHIIHRKLGNKYKTVVGIPMQQERLTVDLPEIENNLIDLSNKINGIPIQFIFNLDETGIVEYEDAQKKFVIVPFNYPKKTAPYPVNRSEKHSSCLVCISMEGMFGIPQITVQRVTIDSEIYDHISKDVAQLVHTTEGYINTSSFKHYMQTIFIPELQKLRKKYNYNGPAILIMDGLLAHRNAVQTLHLNNYNIIPHFLPSHSTDETQPLDLGIFSPMKKFSSNFRRNDGSSTQTNQILKIIKSCQQACSSVACQSAFRAAGIVVDVQNLNGVICQTARFDFSQCKNVRYYQLDYINELISNQMELSPIQQTIIQNNSTPKDKEYFRIKIPTFENNN